MRYRRPLALVAIASTAAFGSACGQNDLRTAVPSQSQLALNVPDDGDGGQRCAPVPSASCTG